MSAMSDFDVTIDVAKLDAPRRTFLERFTARSIGRRRLLALLPILGLSLAASGCIASPSYGVRPYYGDPYYDARGSYYGSRPYYSSQRTVVVRPRRVVVKQPKYRYHRADRVVRLDHRHRGDRADRSDRVYRGVKPASRQHRQVRPHAVRNAPRYIDRKDSRRHSSQREVRSHDRQRSEARGADRRPDRRKARDREHSRDRTWTTSSDQRRHGRGRR